jgi:endoglucanase
MVVARVLGLALAVVATCAACADDYPGLHVDDNRLVDREGRSVRLLGVNRSGGEYACVGGHGFFAGPTGRRAVAAMAAWRINAVRVPLNEHCWLGINGAPSEYSHTRYRKAIRAYVARLHRAGLYVVLDLHWSAPGDAEAGRQQPMPDLDHAPVFWSSVARTFKHDPAIAFDLFNEPHEIGWKCWRDGCALPDGWRAAGMQALVDAVRKTGARQPIIATGIDWGTDLASCTSRECWRRTVEPVAREVPVVVSEVGERECSGAFLDRFMSWADSAEVSYLAWSWNPSGCEAPALIETWRGRPTPSGERVRERLLALKPAKLPSP